MTDYAFWHPFAVPGNVARNGALVIERADGIRVWDTDGNEYIDAIASLWYANVGWGRQEIADAVHAQMSRLPTYQTFGDHANPVCIELAERLAAIAPVADSKVFLTSGGSDAIDTAAKLARRYWVLAGAPDKRVIISRHRAYHGMHGFGTSICGLEPNRAGYGPLVRETASVPWDDATALEARIEELGAGNVAAFFAEPIVGAGGVLIPPAGYLERVRQICRDHDVLFVADEVVCGFGRVGDWFASSRLGLEPDMLTFAKGVTSGYLPLGGVLVAPRVCEPFWREDDPVAFRHGYTFGGHAAACAAALCNLDIMEREGLHTRVLELEAPFVDRVSTLADSALISEVRCGLGLVAAVQFDLALVEKDPTLVGRAIAALRQRGVLTRAVAGHGLQISPPLTVTIAEIDDIVSRFRDALTAVA